MKKFRFHWFGLLLISILVYLQYHLWFAAGGMLKVKQLKTNVATLKVENEMLKEKNAKLWFQVNRLKHNHDATEEKARNELGMIKKDETFYQFVR